jgi:Rpp20 subunit of nuclear RNase MRP and P
VRAMGAAIEKAVYLAAHLDKQGYSLGILTGTTEVVDDITPDDNVLSSNYPR